LWVTVCLLTLPTLVAGFVPGIRSLVLLLDFSLLAFALVDYAIARRAKLKVTRHVPNRLSVGVGNKIELDIITSRGRVWHLRLKDDVPEEFSAEPDTVALTISASSRARLAYRVTPAKRGKFSFGQVHVRTRGPAGLMWHERSLPLTESVAVFPDLRG